ncbi:MAG TPA: hypothetical protein VFN56_05310 [Candidatus Saccharimonadales bacterium]|nr:hypothetical protein [Candidatus Saccharimonadales bacterium]
MIKLPKLFQTNDDQKRADHYRQLIREEAKIGSQLFGPVPAGHRREFFCLDEHTWIWHEEWRDEQDQFQALTTRYDVRPNGILKAQGSQPYQPLSAEEAANLYEAVQLYEARVLDFYRQQPQNA